LGVAYRAPAADQPAKGQPGQVWGGYGSEGAEHGWERRVEGRRRGATLVSRQPATQKETTDAEYYSAGAPQQSIGQHE
jgi:hypothetical protein